VGSVQQDVGHWIGEAERSDDLSLVVVRLGNV